MKKTEEIDEILSYTSKRSHRRAFFNYSTLFYCTGEATFFLLVNQYRKTGKKRQAVFLSEAYVEGKDFGPAVNRFVAGGINVDSKFSKTDLTGNVTRQVSSVGRSSMAKIKKDGFLNFVGSKLSRDPTGVHPDLFDDLLKLAAIDLCNNMGSGQFETGNKGKFNPNASYQPNPDFQMHLPAFRTKLESLKFDTTDLGIF